MTGRAPSALRRVLVSLLLAALSIATVSVASAQEEPEQERGPFFGAGNIPSECEAEMVDVLEDGTRNPDYWYRNLVTPVCHHMRTGLNALDSPQVDVLVLVPLSPTAERDMRIMRQSVEMWEAGIQHVADQLELDWLAQGMQFHITVDVVDLAGGGGEFTTYPVVDPEIVVIATNPVGGLGIGIDPVDFFGFPNRGEGFCHGVANPFDIDAWEALPGFDSHHEARSGTYVEDCGGKGGNICFAVNGAIDPTPGAGPLEDFFSLFDLVSHEVGHCLTVGHVGDGAEGDWGGLPSNDIMAYDADPPGATKCVSSLDVEGVALRMSRYLDVDGDGAVTEADHLEANDQVGQGGNAFQVQRPSDHFYASSTGRAEDCPQPDLGLLPGERTDWTPEPAEEPAP
ncbi:MAG TPA: hypothetical protein VNU66_04265 [Mycobacteriales bacterium]|nr:hypothetical protein [Mycobacteriales bacterium]